MALTYQDLAGMSQEDVIKALTAIYGSDKLQMTEQAGGDVSTGQPVYRSQYNESLVTPNVVGYESRTEGDNAWNAPIYDGYRTQLTSVIDPTIDGGQYGYYAGIYDNNGNLKDVEFQKAERDKGWFGENIDWLGPLMVLGPAAYMAAGAAGAGALAGEGAGFAAGANELAGLAAAEAGFGGSAGLAGLETALAGGVPAGTIVGDTVTFDPGNYGDNWTNVNADLGSSSAGASPTGGGDPFAYGGNDSAAIFGDPSGAASSAAFNSAVAGNSGATLADILAGGTGTAGTTLGTLGSAINAVGGAKNLTALLGGAAGLLSSLNAPDSKTTLQNNKLDPRMDSFVFGQGGLLSKYNQELNRGPMPGLQSAYNIASNYLTGTGPSGSFGAPGRRG